MKIIKKITLVLSLLSFLSTAKAETLVVTTTSDDSTATSCDSTGTGTCSLRGALSVAASGDIVKLKAETYCITDQLTISTSLTLEGVKGSTAIDGANISGSGSTICTTTASGKRILYIDDGSSATTTTPDVLLDGVIIKNGSSTSSDWGGGIIAKFAKLRIENSSIINNQITSPSSELRGGGIYLSDTSLMLINSTVSGNSAVTTSSDKVQGGGITISGSTTVLNIINSTISGNTATSLSSSLARGGGIFSFTGPEVIIQNSTITGNTTNGRGGGINVNNAEVFSSIIYGNMASISGDDCATNTFTSLGNNFILTSTCKDSVGSYATASGDITSGDPLLSTLASNGGPTQTHALDSASPALNTGSCSSTSSDITTINSDQRGYYRTDGSCDIGAFEYFASGTTLTYCGDTLLQSSYGEECDDADSDNTDTCTNSCKNAVCGDGYVQSPNSLGFAEACDDGNTTDDGNGCSATCETATVTDGDADGYASVASGGDDCDDADFSINTGAAEKCDGVDNNCDGLTDESTAIDAPLWYIDNDGDIYGDENGTGVNSCTQPTGYVATNTDCEDSLPSINPGAEEIIGDGIDQNCDGSDFIDADGDDYTSDVDCDDTDSDINPGATETPDNGTDENCDPSDDVTTSGTESAGSSSGSETTDGGSATSGSTGSSTGTDGGESSSSGSDTSSDTSSGSGSGTAGDANSSDNAGGGGGCSFQAY